MTTRANAGSTLIEVLVATLVLVSGVLTMAQLFLLAAATNTAARDTTIAVTLAAQKVEELISTDLADAIGRVDHVDASGHVLSTSESLPAGAAYTRRWSIESLSADLVAIRVRVGRLDPSAGVKPMPGETRVMTIKARRRP